MSDTFRSLHNRNYRLFFFGLTFSLVGSWIQIIAQAALVWDLTHSASQLGYIASAQMVPVLLLSPSAGVLVDRINTRKLLFVTQSILGLIAVLLGVLTMTGSISLWVVYATALAAGVMTAADQPARSAFVSELVPPELLNNAVTLNTVSINAARAVGPAIAGVVIVRLSTGACFLLNGVSYGAVMVALLLMRMSDLFVRRLEPRRKGQLREGLAYAWGHPELRLALAMMTIIGTFTYEFQVTLPAMAHKTFTHSNGDSVNAWLNVAMGVGAVIGGLVTASRSRIGLRTIVMQSFVFGVTVLAVAIAPTEPLALVALLFTGASSITMVSRTSATVQLLADPSKRGRVMSLWTIAFLGTTPVGALIAGWIAEGAGPRWALAMGGIAALLASAYGFVSLRRSGLRAEGFDSPLGAMAAAAATTAAANR